jgi:hypothetical protein
VRQLNAVRAKWLKNVGKKNWQKTACFYNLFFYNLSLQAVFITCFLTHCASDATHKPGRSIQATLLRKSISAPYAFAPALALVQASTQLLVNRGWRVCARALSGGACAGEWIWG